MSEWWQSVNNLLPHGVCYAWDKRLLWLHVISDSLIALAYFSIPFALWVFAKRRRDLEFRPLFILFAAFILLCGVTHVMAIWVVWQPLYYLDGGIKAATGIVSAFTALTLWPLLPKALAIPSPAELQKENDRRREAEADLRHANGELQKRVAQLHALSYSISHDLRAPLRAIDGFSTILLRDHAGALDEAGRNLLIRTEKAAQRLGLSIDGLLHLTRLERDELEMRLLDMQVLVTEVLRPLQTRYPNVQFRLGTLPPALGDENMIAELWQELLDNAAKFSTGRAAPLVEISGHRESENNCYEIRDNGCGYDPHYSGKLFGVFERLHGEEYPGLGLGLALVKRIIERHGGSIEANARPDAGAVFRFRLAAGPAQID